MPTETKPTAAAMRAAEAIWQHTISAEHLAEIIDRETGLPELIEALGRCLGRYCAGCVEANYRTLEFSAMQWRYCDTCSAARAALAKARG